MDWTRNILIISVISMLMFRSGFGHGDDGTADTKEDNTATQAPRPREMEENDLILFNVAAKGRVVELLANELARTEIIRALLVQYAKECVQNVTVLEKHCLNCMIERCENRVAECKIKTPPLSEVLSHDPIPIQGVQFLSAAPRDVQKHLKDFVARARTDILDGIPDSLRKESETIVHKEVDQSLKDLTDNIDTDKALQTISVHMQKAADNAHKIPELSTKVGAIIISNEGNAVNLAELLATRLRDSRPFVDSIEHNSQRIAKQMPSIMDRVSERVASFQDKIAGVFNNVLNTFGQIMDQPDTSVINGNTMQEQIGFQSDFKPNIRAASNFQMNPNMQQFSANQQFSQQQRFIPINVQQQMMQSQIPNRPFPSQVPIAQPFMSGQAQMTRMNIMQGQPQSFNPQFNGRRIPIPVMSNPNQGQNILPPPIRPQPTNSLATSGQPQQTQQFTGDKLNQIPQSNAQFPNPTMTNQIPNPRQQPSVQTQRQGQTQGQIQGQLNGSPIDQGHGQHQHQTQGSTKDQSRQQGQGQGVSNSQAGQKPTQSSMNKPQNSNTNSNQVPISQQNIQRNQMQSVQRIGPARRMMNEVANSPNRNRQRNQVQRQRQLNDAVSQNQAPNNPQNLRRNQVQSSQRMNDVQLGQPNMVSAVSGRKKRHGDADCVNLESSPEKYCKQYESHCHNCTLEKRLRFEVCGEGVEKARDEINRLDKSVNGYLRTYDDFIMGQRLVLKVEMDDEKRLHKTNSYYDAYVTAKIGESIIRYKTKMILNSADTRASGSQIGDEIWEKLWDKSIFREAKRNTIEKPDISILGQTQNRRIPAIQPAAQGSGHSTGSLNSASNVCLMIGTAASIISMFFL